MIRARVDILPEARRRLLPQLAPLRQLGWVLYDGTAIALQLGHKLKVLLQRVEAKDYRDIIAMLAAGQDLRSRVPHGG